MSELNKKKKKKEKRQRSSARVFEARREETVSEMLYVTYKIYQCNIHLRSRGLVYVQRFTNVNSSPLRRSPNARGLSRRFINHLLLYYALRCSTGIPRAAILLKTLAEKQAKEKKKKKRKRVN